MGLNSLDIFATLILNLIHCAYATDHILSCNVTALEPCPGDYQVCNETLNECLCMAGYTRLGDACQVPSTATPEQHSATAVIITIFTLALIGCGLFLVIRKYHLIEYVRQKINLRRNNDVMYEDVMIGQDDPPLSP